MPPRYAYWTILIDDKPTAFRAREREELQPTFAQLQRKNTNVTMQWFARGKLWASREAERDDFQMQKHAASAPRAPRGDRPEGAPEKRGSAWRPGGKHVDPRDRFKKKNRPERAWSEKDPATQRDRDKPGYVAKKPWEDKKPGVAQAFRPAGGDRKLWRDKPAGPPRGDRPWQNKPPSGERRPWQDKKPAASAPPSDRPWQTKPTGPRAQRKPWVGKPTGTGDRPWQNKPAGDGRRPGPSGPGEKRPWSGKPSGPPRGDRPWRDKPAGDGRRPGPSGPGEKRPWSGKPRGDKPGGFSAGGPPRGDRKPWEKKPFRPSGPPRSDSRGSGPNPRKKRDDEPPDRG